MAIAPGSARAKRHDVIVIGGGLIGCLAARALGADGWRVLLVERAAGLGQEASGAAAGLLSPQMEAVEEILVSGPGQGRRHEAMLDLCLAARAAYPGFVAALESETGAHVHYRRDGTLVVALDTAAARTLARRAQRQRARGLRAEWLEGAEARALEPEITPEAPGALHLPDDHQIDNVALLAAVGASLGRLPAVEVRSGTGVEAIVERGGRVAGVRLDGATVPARLVVLAAGAWSGGLGGLPRRVPVRPVKGQMAALAPQRPPFRKIVGGRGVYCVPRDDGRVLVGATVEEAGFDTTVDPAAVERLLAVARAVVPVLERAPIVRAWAGLRPGTADDLPLLGPDPELEGLIWAAGHFRNGILLAPLTAEVVAAAVRGQPPPVDLRPFAPDRDFR